MNQHITLYADGLCEPCNPGGVAAGGWLIQSGEGGALHAGFQVFGEGDGATNNIAEYRAVMAGLDWLVLRAAALRNAGYATLTVRSDSQLVIYQTAGRWNCNPVPLRLLRDGVRERLEALKAVGFVCSLQWIPRQQNAAADALSRRAYHEHTGHECMDRSR